MLFPFVGVEFFAGIEVGELLDDFGVKGFIGAALGIAPIVLRPQSMQYKSQLSSCATLLRVIAAFGRTIVRRPGERQGIAIKLPWDIATGGITCGLVRFELGFGLAGFGHSGE